MTRQQIAHALEPLTSEAVTEAHAILREFPTGGPRPPKEQLSVVCAASILGTLSKILTSRTDSEMEMVALMEVADAASRALLVHMTALAIAELIGSVTMPDDDTGTVH